MPLRKISAERIPNLTADYYNKKPELIPGEADLDDYVTPGVYVQIVNTGAASGNNYPLPKAGLLEVFVNGNTEVGEFGMIWQRYTVYGENSNDGQVLFQRTLYNGTWLNWEAINYIIVSNSNPSGTAYEGAMWYKV